ncbi:MAG: hypothetical protein IPJ87_14700 [Flavobacteriales bacterium]|nr:hypothetical protein [Flavobacteriales bacterium]MBK7943099.1 hypothetical protein [Flavobacteriales bacterium]MBK9698496.1 hypothetical protein [Flavobacteriales bacterium]
MSGRLHTALLLLALPALGVAQTDLLAEALRKYQAGALNEARALVDEAVLEPGHQRDPEAWLLRGFILKDLYKAKTGTPQGEADRDSALASLDRCLAHDQGGDYTENAAQAYDFLSKTYFNDAARALNELRPDDALALYGKYTAATDRRGAPPDRAAKDVEFHNALGTVYTKLYNQDREQLSWYDKAVATYEQVLRIDTGNYGANYNLATLYYNRGVYNIQRVGAEYDIPSLQRIQEVSREFFLQALPYMLKAFRMNPKRRETLLGLEGIYYSLQDAERSEHYRKLFEELGPEEDR